MTIVTYLAAAHDASDDGDEDDSKGEEADHLQTSGWQGVHCALYSGGRSHVDYLTSFRHVWRTTVKIAPLRPHFIPLWPLLSRHASLGGRGVKSESE